MSGPNNVSNFYKTVIGDVMKNSRDAFLNEGVDEQVWRDLQSLWKTKVEQSHSVESAAPEPPQSHVLLGPQQQYGPVPAALTGSVKRHVAGVAGVGLAGTDVQTTAISASGSAPLYPSTHGVAHTGIQHLLNARGSQVQGDLLTTAAAAVASGSSYSSLARSAPPAQPPPPPSSASQARRGGLPQYDGACRGPPTACKRVHEDHGEEDAACVSLASASTGDEVSSQGSACGSQASVLQPSRKRRKILPQLDGAHASSSEEDEDVDDDENDDDDDDDDDDDHLLESDYEDDGEKSEHEVDDPLGSEDDGSESDGSDIFDTDNVVVCQFDRVARTRNKWKFVFKDGIMHLNGKDHVFVRSSGEAEW